MYIYLYIHMYVYIYRERERCIFVGGRTCLQVVSSRVCQHVVTPSDSVMSTTLRKKKSLQGHCRWGVQ